MTHSKWWNSSIVILYSFLVAIICSKHALRQLKKFVYLCSIYSPSVLNMGSINDFAQGHELSVLFLDLQAIYTEYGLEHDLLEQKKTVHRRSTYSLSVIIMA